MKRAALALALLLAGCAGDGWHLAAPGFEPDYIQVSYVEDLARFCGKAAAGMFMQGCAQRAPERRACQVYIAVQATDRAAVLAHELKHCAGYDHANAINAASF